MADYIFNIYLHTDKSTFDVDYPLNEYFYDLSPFFFTRNEFVDPYANIEILKSALSCRGANMFNASATAYGMSSGTTDTEIKMSYSATISIGLSSKSDATGSNNESATGLIYPWCWSYANPIVI